MIIYVLLKLSQKPQKVEVGRNEIEGRRNKETFFEKNRDNSFIKCKKRTKTGCF